MAETPTPTPEPTLQEVASKLASIPNNPLLDADDPVTDPVSAAESFAKNARGREAPPASSTPPWVIPPEDKPEGTVESAAEALLGQQDSPALGDDDLAPAIDPEAPQQPEVPPEVTQALGAIQGELAGMEVEARQLAALEADTQFWDQLRTTDPARWTNARQELRQKQAQLAAHAEQLQARSAMVQQSHQQQQFTEYVAREGRKLLGEIPGWSTTLSDGRVVPTKRASREAQALERYLLGLGWSSQTIGAMSADDCVSAYNEWQASKTRQPAKPTRRVVKKGHGVNGRRRPEPKPFGNARQGSAEEAANKLMGFL